ncbi:hypothetical protein ACAG39_07750 [Caldicellulosiruptoraceae bacterium PP1]
MKKRIIILFLTFLIIFIFILLQLNYINIKYNKEGIQVNKEIITYIPNVKNDKYLTLNGNKLIVNNRGVQLIASLKAQPQIMQKPGLILDLIITNYNNFSIQIDLLNIKIGKENNGTYITFYPSINKSPIVNINPKQSVREQLLYFPINNELQNITHAYLGDLLKTYILDIKNLRINSLVITNRDIKFTANKEQYEEYIKKYSKNNKFVDYQYKLDNKLLDTLKTLGYKIYSDITGLTIMNKEGVVLNINLFKDNDKTYLKLKILNKAGFYEQDEKEFKVIDLIINIKKIILFDDKNRYICANNFNQLKANNTKNIINKDTYILYGSEKFEWILEYPYINKAQIYLDLRGITFKQGGGSFLSIPLEFVLQK